MSVGIFFAREWRSIEFRRNELLSAPECAFGVHPTLEYVDVRYGQTGDFQRRFRPRFGEDCALSKSIKVDERDVLEWRL